MRHMKREFPTIRGWDSNLLRFRQKNEMQSGGFGHGFVDERFDPTTHIQGAEEYICNIDGDDLKSNDAGEDEDGLGEAKAYTHNLIKTARMAADSMSKLLLMIQNAPVQIRQNECFKLAVETSKHLVGVTRPSASDLSSPYDTVTQVSMDLQWNKQEWNDCPDKMLDMLEKRDELNSTLGYPSFSMGFTQNPIFNQEV